jgi:FkbM family methyltransferase
MLIPFDVLVDKYKLKIEGILHVGSHECEELRAYNSQGIYDIVWIDAIPEKVTKTKLMYPSEKIYNAIISDKDNESVVFHVSNNYQSSSLLEFKRHADFHPEIHYIQEIHGKTVRLDTFFEKNNLNPEKYNFMNIDIQGTELQALISLGDLINNFDYIYLEVNEEELYKGCALFDEVENFLNEKGLYCVEKVMTDQKWGDAMFIRYT